MTPRPPAAPAQLAAFLSRFPPRTEALAKQCLSKLRRALPGTNEIVYDYRTSIVVSFSYSDRGYEGIVTMKVQPEGVQLYFAKDLPDPKGRLGGSGSKVRSVAVASASELDRGAVHDLVRAAVRHAGSPPKRTGPTRIVIQSGSKPKPKRKRTS